MVWCMMHVVSLQAVFLIVASAKAKSCPNSSLKKWPPYTLAKLFARLHYGLPPKLSFICHSFTCMGKHNPTDDTLTCWFGNTPLPPDKFQEPLWPSGPEILRKSGEKSDLGPPLVETFPGPFGLVRDFSQTWWSGFGGWGRFFQT